MSNFTWFPSSSEKKGRIRLNRAIRYSLLAAAIMNKKQIRYFSFYLSLSLYHEFSVLKRKWNGLKGLLVPAALMISITRQCNLNCMGCYMHAKKPEKEQELTLEELINLTTEAKRLGVFILVFAGGEPLIRFSDIRILAAGFPKILMPVFTNGTIYDNQFVSDCINHPNILPIISMEGEKPQTDGRRGMGVYKKAQTLCSVLHKSCVLFGCSFTTTTENIHQITSLNFIKDLYSKGCRLFIFVEFVPMSENEHLCLTPYQITYLNERIKKINSTFPVLALKFPGDQEWFSGCLAAGRGFAHISPSGSLEACPASEQSDRNIRNGLANALQSPLFETIRQSGKLNSEKIGGCSLVYQEKYEKN